MKTLAQIRKIDSSSADSDIIDAMWVATKKALRARSEKSRREWSEQAERLRPLSEEAFESSCAEMEREARDIRNVFCAAA